MTILSTLWLLKMLSFACYTQAGPTEGPGNTTYNGPIRLHPINPHYFEYKGKLLVLLTSGEHYGALLNQAFDYRKYLDTLAADGMNYTRIFSGTYCEIPGESFGIRYNTLAPETGQFLTPWNSAGAEENRSKRKYDLTSWNDRYFARLRDLVGYAAEREIIVEVTLFTSIYREEHWEISPENPANNINVTQPINRFQAHTLENGDLLSLQEEFVRKMVRELNTFDNVFFEIQNEPWADHNVPVYNIVNKEELRPDDWGYKVDYATEESMAWQAAIASFIRDEESDLPAKHLIAQNFSNFKAPLAYVPDYVSIINFHYNWPETAWWNYHFDRAIGFDESGFAGPGDTVYRRQAWRFLLAGGGLFNNLDYSFFTGYEDGTVENTAPGGGNVTLRRQFRVLSEFIHGLELLDMKPDQGCIIKAPGMLPYVLSDGRSEWAIFLQAVNIAEGELTLKLPDGDYQLQAQSTLSGEIVGKSTLSVNGNRAVIPVRFVHGEIAIRLTR